MFCVECGNNLPAGARFCSSCGTAVAAAAAKPAQARPQPQPQQPQQQPTPTSSYAGSPPMTPAQHSPLYSLGVSNGPASPPGGGGSTVLFSSAGTPQPAFGRLAGALFNGLDHSIAPQNTGALEASKMMAWRTMGGLTVPPYYAEYVLPTYASVVGMEMVPGQPQGSPIVTWSGWHAFLAQKILLEPDACFAQTTRVLAALGVRLPLRRADFPRAPSPAALAKENQFKTAIYSLARGGMGAGFGGFGGVALAGHAPSGGAGGHSGTGAAIAKVAVKGTFGLLNNVMTGGGAGSGQFFGN